MIVTSVKPSIYFPVETSLVSANIQILLVIFVFVAGVFFVFSWKSKIDKLPLRTVLHTRCASWRTTEAIFLTTPLK